MTRHKLPGGDIEDGDVRVSNDETNDAETGWNENEHVKKGNDV